MLEPSIFRGIAASLLRPMIGSNVEVDVVALNWFADVRKQISHFRILGIGLELACNGGSCGGISSKGNECNLHLKRLPRISLTNRTIE